MNYDETCELEANIKIRNKANELYELFFENVMLNPNTFKNGKFKIWSDSHNAKYVYIVDDHFVYECCFLHEHYVLDITLDNIFNAIKRTSRVVDHFSVDVNKIGDL